jgi:hypothetical protein
MSKRHAEDVMKPGCLARVSSKAMNDATGKLGPKPSHGKDFSDEPLSSRIVTNYELRRLGHWQPSSDADDEL